jgi:hypothetical protein
MRPKKQDNTTFLLKTQLRVKALAELENPIVLEAYGGYGRVFARCYPHLRDGVVFDKLPERARTLAQQRPTWAVYEADCVKALSLGVGNHLPVNFLDLDPYGEPWPALDAFLESDRLLPPRLVICTNDGLRQRALRGNSGWTVKSLQPMVDRVGNAALHDNYLDVCRTMVTERAIAHNYRLEKWTGYYCGLHLMMTHWAAVLTAA